MQGISFREATIDDLEKITLIEKDNFGDAWGEDALYTCLTGAFYNVTVALLEDEIIGYGVTKCIYEDGELIRIAIDNAQKRQGIGTNLLIYLVEQSKMQGVEQIFLDVRASNEAARRLYEDAGFVSYGITRDFYREPREDSIKYRKDLR